MQRFVNSPLPSRPYDLLIIGGGITGAALAYEAATQGLRCALIEREDFGWATSAATSKLIHGGLRYLKNLEFGLVRESLRERLRLQNISPNLVVPIPFLVPVYRQQGAGKFILRAGMIAYDMLSFDKNRTWDSFQVLPGHRMLSAQEALEIEPLLPQKGLNGAALYYDCQSIQPERLTLAFLKSAVEKGAEIANYVEAKGFLFEDENRIIGVSAYDHLKKQQLEIQARWVVNCAGPWADEVLALNPKNQRNHSLKRSEGIHIITPKINRAQNTALAMITPDGRHVMVLPWRGHSLIGTTDKTYQGPPDEWKITRQSIEELLDDINNCFGERELKYEDVKFAYGGLRPLVDDQTRESYQASRKYEIFDHEQDGLAGLLTVEGGKYTTSRQLAEDVMVVLAKKGEIAKAKSLTADSRLKSCEIPNLLEFEKQMHQTFADLPKESVDYISHHYGTEAPDILQLARDNRVLQQRLTPDGELLAEVDWVLKKEMAFHLDDVIFRRTGIGTLGHPGEQQLKTVAQHCALHLGWDEKKTAAEISKCEARFRLP